MKVNLARTGPARSSHLDMALPDRKRHSDHMKRQLKLLSVCVALAAFLSTAYGGVPGMSVTVFDANEKVVFKQSLNSNASFASGKLPAGRYVVQFNTKSPAAKDNQYLAVVSAGKKRIIATGVPGERFMAGGAAMKIDVGPGLTITGQITKEDPATAQTRGPISRVIDGKRYIWVSAQTGTNLAGRWEDASVAPAHAVVVWSKDELRKRWDRAGEGSMITSEAMENFGTHGSY
jgi:hypothetical protein